MPALPEIPAASLCSRLTERPPLSESSYDVVVNAGMNSLTNSRRPSDAPAENTAVVARFGPPLTSAEQILRAGIVAALLVLLGTEAWLIWHAWSLWG
jgi:hypothetical protein